MVNVSMGVEDFDPLSKRAYSGIAKCCMGMGNSCKPIVNPHSGMIIYIIVPWCNLRVRTKNFRSYEMFILLSFAGGGRV